MKFMMSKKTVLGFIFCLLSAIVLAASGEWKALYSYLPKSAHYEEALSLEVSQRLAVPSPLFTGKSQKNLSLYLFTMDENFDQVKASLEAKKIQMQEVNKDALLKKGLAINPWKDPDYRRATGKTQDGWGVVLESKKLNPATKQWLNKTTVVFIKAGASQSNQSP